MRVVHVNEAALGDAGLEPVMVSEADVTSQDAASKVKFLSVLQQLHRTHVEPRTTVDPEREREPVRQIHEVLVLDLSRADGGLQSVVDAGRIGTRVVDGVGPGLGHRATRRETPVSQRAKSLAKPLALRVEALVCEQPAVQSESPVAPSRRARLGDLAGVPDLVATRTSARSRTTTTAPAARSSAP